MRTFIIVLFAFLFLISINSLKAQDENPVLVFSQNMVNMSDMGMINKAVDSLTAPIWNELMSEGMIMGWGQLNHEWGDEWNCNFYYVAKDKESFFKAWDEFIKRMGERHPGAWSTVTPSFRAHKDNIYYFQQRHNPKQ